ncbi:hypothetical protein [Micromonospora sp. WMMD980]|uniref:hypothetical protein n=1 Tax=Micromonospora sp. WMMD980 TaxID=3016088 RepID=UPI002417F463|nr:hypothetical protein [Micromonospora sp. WMMD980]MDG4801462.1 hypothetical protein [Micromonospora sp. WMMD980]
MPNDQDLDNAIEAIVVDAYGADEQHSAFLAVIEDETPLPTAATLLGTPVPSPRSTTRLRHAASSPPAKARMARAKSPSPT